MASGEQGIVAALFNLLYIAFLSLFQFHSILSSILSGHNAVSPI